MPSREILDKLFEVEQRAESLVTEAQAEAQRRASIAKETAEAAFRKAYDAAVRVEEAKRSEALAATDSECRAELDEYRARLENSSLEKESFAKSCDSFIAGLF